LHLLSIFALLNLRAFALIVAGYFVFFFLVFLFRRHPPHRFLFSLSTLAASQGHRAGPSSVPDRFLCFGLGLSKKKERKKSRPVTPHPRTHALSVSVRILFLSCVRELVLTKKNKYRTGPDQVFDVLCTVDSLIAFSGWSPSRPKKKGKTRVRPILVWEPASHLGASSLIASSFLFLSSLFFFTFSPPCFFLHFVSSSGRYAF
jgi:hypothetical protein